MGDEGEESAYLVRREAGDDAVPVARSGLRHRVIVKQCHAAGGGARTPPRGAYAPILGPQNSAAAEEFFPVQPTIVAKSAKNRPAMQRSAKILAVAGDTVISLTERATHAHPLHPAALASVPYGIVLVRVRFRRASLP